MKRKSLSIVMSPLLAVLAMLAGANSARAAEYIYSKLQMKTYDQMRNAVNGRVRQAEQISDKNTDKAKAELQDALQLIFSRPDTDNMVSELVPIVRAPLNNMGAYYGSLSKIVNHAISNINNKSLNASVRTTGFIILENVMSELRPELRKTQIKALFARIKNAKIKIPSAVKSELFLRASIRIDASPSEIAAKILKAETHGANGK